MKALTLIQPWATLIMLGEKKIETRSWNTKYRGQIAIHAGKKVDKKVFCDPFYKDILKKHNISLENIQTSCIIATCDILDVQSTESLIGIISDKEKKLGNFSPNRFGWILTNINPIVPTLPAKGMLGLWEYKGRI